ncbi:helix-turn-helix domain-containing protein [Segatella copri]|uniref:helix-turn-helix domain-containing protein n=1 Tax=Segatella copri TaxID=165179 RepID=UPI0020CA4D58|nr:helix-turn-helix transcriptional regulator [Segatella copri]
MKDRIRQIMEDQKLNQQSFAQLIGKSTATLSNIFNDRTKPTLDIVDAIKKKFPQVNTEWLLFGTPPMYINKVEGGAAASSSGASVGAGSMGTEDSLDMYGGASASAGMGAQGGMPGAGGVAGGAMEPSLDFGADGQDSSPASPSLFDQPQMHGVKRTPKNIANAAVKIVDKPQRRITEIRIFYDDQTWETFVPKK